MGTVDFASPFYPYEKVQTGFLTFKGAESIPYKILMYLLDLPDKAGYMPADDNSRPRVRFAKYLWYDGENPLNKPLPSPKEKLSMLYDGNEAVLNTSADKKKHPVGYRLFPQLYIHQSELEAKTTVKVYIGRVINNSPTKATIGLAFEIGVNCEQDNVSKTTAYSKIYAIECVLIEALHGVNIAGVGVVNISRQAHTDNGSRPYHDEGVHIYRHLHMSIDWQESSVPEYITAY